MPTTKRHPSITVTTPILALRVSNYYIAPFDSMICHRFVKDYFPLVENSEKITVTISTKRLKGSVFFYLDWIYDNFTYRPKKDYDWHFVFFALCKFIHNNFPHHPDHLYVIVNKV